MERVPSSIRVPTIVIGVLAFFFVAISQFRTLSEPDFFTHLAAGRAWAAQRSLPPIETLSYTASGAVLRGPGWLFDALLYALWATGGVRLVTTFFILLLLSAFILALTPNHERSSPLSAAAAVVLAGWLAASRSAVAPMTFSIFFAALFLRMFSRHRPLLLTAAVLIPAQILWTQIDDGFLIGPILALVAAVEFAWDRRSAGGPTLDERRRILGLFALTAVLLASAILHPAGWGVYRTAFAGWREPVVPAFNVWISPVAYLIGSTFFRRLLVAALLIGAFRLMVCPQRLPLLITVSALLGAFLALRSVFMLPLFAGLALPFLSLSIADLAREVETLFRIGEHAAKRVGMLALGIVTMLSIALFTTGYHYRRIGSLSRLGLGIEERPYPSAAAPLLDRQDFAMRPIHLPMDGGFLAWRYPHRPVFCDMRKGVFAPDFRRLVARWAAGDTSAFDAIVEQSKGDALVINALWPSAGELIRAPIAGGGWSLIYFDGVTAILLPKRPENASWFESTALGEIGLRRLDEEVNRFIAEVQAGRRPPPPPAAIGAAEVFAALDRNTHAADLYEWLARVMPSSPHLDLQRGIAQVKAGRIESACISLTSASRRLAKNSTVWFWLAQAHARAGRRAEADRAIKQAERLAPSTAAKTP